MDNRSSIKNQWNIHHWGRWYKTWNLPHGIAIPKPYLRCAPSLGNDPYHRWKGARTRTGPDRGPSGYAEIQTLRTLPADPWRTSWTRRGPKRSRWVLHRQRFWTRRRRHGGSGSKQDPHRRGHAWNKTRLSSQNLLNNGGLQSKNSAANEVWWSPLHFNSRCTHRNPLHYFNASARNGIRQRNRRNSFSRKNRAKQAWSHFWKGRGFRHHERRHNVYWKPCSPWTSGRIPHPKGREHYWPKLFASHWPNNRKTRRKSAFPRRDGVPSYRTETRK